MLSKNIKAHSRIIEFLTRSFLGNRISHAYIFFGPAGIGKKLTAIYFARLLSCTDVSSAAPCGECASCKKIEGGNHPDVHLIAPAERKSSLGIDEIRDIIKSVYLKPYEGSRKICIVDDADTLTHEAQNALLKTLEEPPSDAVIILITRLLSSLLPTIVSRSQHVRFSPLSQEDVKDILKKEYAIEDSAASILARISSGSMESALQYNDEEFFRFRLSILKDASLGRHLNLDAEADKRSDIKRLLDIALSWYRDILIIKSGINDAGMLINIDQEKELRKSAGSISFDKAGDCIKQILLTISFLDQNANPKIAMSVLNSSIR